MAWPKQGLVCMSLPCCTAFQSAVAALLCTCLHDRMLVYGVQPELVSRASQTCKTLILGFRAWRLPRVLSPTSGLPCRGQGMRRGRRLPMSSRKLRWKLPCKRC